MSQKEKLISVMDFLGENEAEEVLQYIRTAFMLKPKSWDDIPEDDPTEDEIQTIAEYRGCNYD